MKRFFFLIMVLMLCICSEAFAADPMQDGDYEYIILEDGTAAITAYVGEEKQVSIPEKLGDYTVTAINEKSFIDSAARDIRIPDCVTYISGNAFNKMYTTLYLNDSNPSFALIEGNLYEKATRTLIAGLNKELNIPEGIVAIGDYACAYMEISGYTSITLPSTLTSIGEYAFYKSVLPALHFPAGITVISKNAFALTSATDKGPLSLQFDGVIEEIGDSAFCYAYLEELPLEEGLVRIGEYAFEHAKFRMGTQYSSSGSHNSTCKENLAQQTFRDVVFPSTLKEIGANAFASLDYVLTSGSYQCTCSSGSTSGSSSGSSATDRIKADMIAQTNALLNNFGSSSSSSAFGSSSVINKYEVFHFIYPSGCEAAFNIADFTFAFGDAGLMVSFEDFGMDVMPVSIGKGAFEKAAIVDFGSNSKVEITALGESAFVSAYVAFNELTLGSEVTDIPNWAFTHSNLLMESIPAQVTRIGKGAFNSVKLEKPIMLSDKLESIAEDAFKAEQAFKVKSGSYAETWCQETFQQYEVIGAKQDMSWLTGATTTDTTEEAEELYEGLLTLALIEKREMEAACEADYQAALALEGEGKYEEAIALYSGLNGYKDSAERIAACEGASEEGKYQQALALENEGKYEEAIALYSANESYKDSADRILSCKYANAVSLMDGGKFDDAISCFTALESYSDSAAMISECNYRKALYCLDNNDIQTAYALMQALQGYKDANELLTGDQRFLEEAARQFEANTVPGKVVTVGSYDGNAINWVVAERDGRNALLVASKSLFHGRMHDKETTITWEKCTLRQYLNGEFLESCFTEEERAAIRPTINVNPDYQRYSTDRLVDGGPDTEDMVFLLERKEFQEFLERGYESVEADHGYYIWTRSVGHMGNHTGNKKLYDYEFLSVYLSSKGTVEMEEHKVVAKGCIMPSMWVDLYEFTGTKPVDGVSPAKTYDTLSKGSKGENVKRLQEKLIDAGILSGTADGAYGNSAATAVAEAQKRLGMEATGVADNAFLTAFYSEENASLFPKVYTDKETVKAVQTALNEAGFDCGTPDGAAGKKTIAALTDYQTSMGLNATGTITHETLVSMGLAE